ncbi:sugar phosphate isomerase/epimerase family protein [Anaerosalibacter massiliensis]|uniref:Sugar phosphate isomerase/epimerase n=1 Tax=Anaerosalibacter massiliensis TaxID=1347392 RepID=A0A9X2MKW2_9FIRM|nr:sugar phosphate isomerase/epimerase [Anaerosalibacter massiliensis]MCR2045027.1 sugar phosphate isomerase/epimerase [Anaerosalibacter massiliensis]
MGCKLGMPTLIEKDNIIDNIILCKELGLDFIELNMNLPYCMPEYISSKELSKLKNKYDIEFTIHFPEDIDFGYFYEEIGQANIRLFQSIARWGAEFGVEKINLHLNPGVYFTLPHEKIFVYEKNEKFFYEKFLGSIVQIRDIAEPLGIKICVENMQVHKFVEKAYESLCNIPKVYFTWDIGHDAMWGYKMEKIYLKNPQKVKHMHFHDYDRKSDHQVLFTGTIPLDERLKFAKENNLTVVIETKTTEALVESVKKLKDRQE